MSALALYAFEIERILFRIFLGAMIVHFVRKAWQAWRMRPAAAPPADADWPAVTVQLPIKNELYVAERALRAAAALDYPRERLEIQVLDHSDDGTIQVIDRTAAELAAAGAPLIVLRPDARAASKAASLAQGLAAARGALIAIFDADAIPAPDFLRRTVPALLAEPALGMVQGRLVLQNRRRSPLTRAQAVLLDGLMCVEQAVQSRRGRPLHFNGSAGVWRRECIEAAGGWRPEALAEDMDLSYRAQLGGWTLRHLPEVTVAAELPETLPLFRVQQRRWTSGKFQVLRTLGRRITAARRPLSHRLDMLIALTSRVLAVFLSILVLTMPLTTFNWIRPLVKYTIGGDAALLGLVLSSASAYFAVASWRSGAGPWEALKALPVVTALFFGLSFSHTAAAVSGLVRRAPAFEGTPKRGALPPRAPSIYRAPADRLALLEIAVGGAYVAFTALALGRHLWPAAAFFSFVALSYLWVGAGTLLR